jgi:3-phosphoshikimate 1-carboxyvinyltransferase
MKNLVVTPSKPSGSITIPPSKSHTLRAILFALMADGVSTIQNYLISPDTDAMIKACQALGAEITYTDRTLQIKGVAGSPLPAPDIIQAGNSGLVLRFISALCALLPSYSIITGDHSIKTQRPILPLLEGLNQLGALAEAIGAKGHPPVIIKGPIHPGHLTIDGQDSQPISAILIAASFLKGTTEVHVDNPGERPWIDMTLYWLDKLSIPFARQGYDHFTLHGHAKYKGFDVKIPGDFSSAAFPMAAALITKSHITIHNLDQNEIQGDKKIIDIFQSMGASIQWADQNTLSIDGCQALTGVAIDINDCIDALPILAAVGCYASGSTHIYNGAIARKKESDRISAITKELKKLGAHIEEHHDGLIIKQSNLYGTPLFSHHDHRIAMSLAVAALGAKGNTCIQDAECINKTYKDFAEDFTKIGCGINVL